MAVLNRKVDYALLILSYLHHHGEGGCARAIAAQFGLSRPFVANILKDLCRQGYVSSQRGVKGGYRLQRPPTEIRMAELMAALEEPFYLAECCTTNPGDHCDIFGVCPLKGAVGELHHRIRQVLAEVTLAELLKPPVEAGGVPVALEITRCQRSEIGRPGAALETADE